MKFNYSILSFALGILLVSCEKKAAITISGSTTVLPVVSKAAENFIESHSNLNIIVNAGGSGVGINQLGEGETVMGMASREITEEEINKFPNVDFNVIPIGRDAVVPVVSSEVYNAGVTTLTLKQIGKIYKGEITNWKELGGSDSDILCIDKESSRGTRHVFMNAVFGDEDALTPGADLVLGANNEEQTAIIQSDAAIGMLSNAWLNKDVVGLNILMSDSSVIAPTMKNIIDGIFPIMRNLNVITNGAPKNEIKEFIDYLLSDEGQKIVTESEYVSINK